MDDGSGEDAGGFKGKILSCIAELKPFTVRVKWSSERNTHTKILAAPEEITIVWPLEAGQDVPKQDVFTGGVTDVSSGGQLESRMESTIQITPTGTTLTREDTEA